MPTPALCARRTALLVLSLTAAACSAFAEAPATATLAPSPTPPATSMASATAPPSAAAVDDVTVRPGEPWIVYQGGTGGPSRIRLVRPDGTGDHVLVEHVPGENPDGWHQHPDWSRDGTQIAFGVEAADGAQDLWAVNADGTDTQMLFDCVAPCGWSDHPAWSPDGRTIAFVSADHVGDADSLAYVDLLDVATGKHRRILQAPRLTWCYGPRWASDGHRLVVECDVFKTARFDEEEATAKTIGIVDTAAARPVFEPLLSWTSWAVYPDWDPTEDRIVFELPSDRTQPQDAADLSLLDPATGDQTALTHFGSTGGWAIQPTWTPDGSAITFVAEDVIRTHPNYAEVRADGTGLRRLNDGFSRTHPRLRPVP